MSTEIYPNEWKKIICKYPNPFEPRFIFGEKGNWKWQACQHKMINITHWKTYWILNGEEYLATLDEWIDKRILNDKIE